MPYALDAVSILSYQYLNAQKIPYPPLMGGAIGRRGLVGRDKREVLVFRYVWQCVANSQTV